MSEASSALRREVETTVDNLETWVADDAVKAEFIEAFPDLAERATIAARLFGVGPALHDFALAIWPEDEAQAKAAAEAAAAAQ